MSELSTYDVTLPLDTDLEGDGAAAIRNLALLVKERLELDHNMDGELDPTTADCDGYHKQVTLNPQSADVTPPTGAGALYSKTVSSVNGVFWNNGSSVIRII